MIRALLFDLDNTLIDRNRAYQRYVDDLLRRLAGTLPEPAAGLSAELMVHDDGGRGDRGAHCRWLAERLAFSGWSADDFWQDQITHLPRFVEPDPEVDRLLNELLPRYSLAIVSNGSSLNQREKICRAGLAPCFENVLISQEVGCAKPSPEIFAEALARLHCGADEALMVGDDLENDILGAAAVGLGTIWIQPRTPSSGSFPGLRIGRLSDLPRALATSGWGCPRRPSATPQRELSGSGSTD